MAKLIGRDRRRTNRRRLQPDLALARSAHFLERRLRIVDLAGVRGRRPQLDRRPSTVVESVLVGLRQSRRRVPVRNVFSFHKRGRRSHLKFPLTFSQQAAARRSPLFVPPPARFCSRAVANSFPSIFVALIAALNNWIIRRATTGSARSAH